MFARVLGLFRLNDEDEKWHQAAYEILAKKLKDDPYNQQALQDALTKKTPSTACVLLPRSADGRVQVRHKKLQPHVISARLFRWNDVQNHQQLRHLEQCEWAYKLSKNCICINPYHYERIESACPPSIVTPRGEGSVDTFANKTTVEASSLDNGHLVKKRKPSESVSSIEVSSRDGTSIDTPINSPFPSVSEDCFVGGASASNFGAQLSIVSHLQNMNLQPAWAKIYYYEEALRVTDGINITAPNVTIDGYTDINTATPDPNSQRIALGSFSRPARHKSVEHIRSFIEKGIVLEFDGVDRVTLKVKSRFPVFIISRVLNDRNNFASDCVAKLNAGNDCVVYSLKYLTSVCERYQGSKFREIHGIANEYSVFRVSFVKGWGQSYKRSDISQTPCWIEVQMCSAFQQFDNIMSNKENTTITSTD